MNKSQKIAVVLFNLGGPDKTGSIQPFLKNFFLDKNIIRLPFLLRWPLAQYIAFSRSRREAGDSYAELGGRSPLLENTQTQAATLERVLNKDGVENYRVFVCMRYWHPMAAEVTAQVKQFSPDQIVLLPLYPQYSTTTTRSSLQTWNKAAADTSLSVPTSMICCYPEGEGFVAESAKNVRTVYDQAKQDAAAENLPAPRVLFSAHGLPESVIEEGDPYQWQCEQSAGAIARAAGLADDSWQICYQSRVGPKKWIGPSTEEALDQAAADNVPAVVYPHAFVNEHVETLVEIEIEYREYAEAKGVPLFYRVPTVNDGKAFMEDLANLVKARVGTTVIVSNTEKRLCPKKFTQCCMQECRLGEAQERKVA